MRVLISADTEGVSGVVRVAPTKSAIDRTTSRCLPPAVTAERIRATAREVVEAGAGLTPYSLEPPYTFRIQVKDSTQAAVCTYFPSVIREGPTTISLTSDDYREAFRGFIDMALLVSSTASGI